MQCVQGKTGHPVHVPRYKQAEVADTGFGVDGDQESGQIAHEPHEDRIRHRLRGLPVGEQINKRSRGYDWETHGEELGDETNSCGVAKRRVRVLPIGQRGGRS